MSNRSPILTEDNSGLATPLEPGSVIPGPTPGYYQIAAPGVALALDDLTDVTITAPVNGNFFQYDGSKWVNNTVLTSGRIPFVTTNGRLADSTTLVRNATTNQVGITTTANTGLLVTDTTGLGELAFKARCSAGTGTTGQSGFDFGFNNSYRCTMVVAGSGVGAPFGNSAYMYLAGVPLRFITDASTRGVEFYPNFAYAGRFYGTTLQMGANGTTASTINIPSYMGKNAATVQLRVGDTSGNCWSIGRDNVSTGDLIIEPTAPAGTTAFPGALKVSASGKTIATYGAQVSTLTASKEVWATTAGELTTTAPAGSSGTYKRHFMFMGG